MCKSTDLRNALQTIVACMNTSDSNQHISRDKIRARLRALPPSSIRSLLHRAIDLLSQDQLPALIHDHIHIRRVLADDGHETTLLQSIQSYHDDAMRGHFYESFFVDSRNYTDESVGTQAFFAEHHRFIDACLAAAQRGEYTVAAKGLGRLLDLVFEVDRGNTDIVFFADDGGSYSFGISLSQVLPIWFRCLAHTHEPNSWAETIAEAVQRLDPSTVSEVLLATQPEVPSEYQQALLPLLT